VECAAADVTGLTQRGGRTPPRMRDSVAGRKASDRRGGKVLGSRPDRT